MCFINVVKTGSAVSVLNGNLAATAQPRVSSTMGKQLTYQHFFHRPAMLSNLLDHGKVCNRFYKRSERGG